MHLAEDGGVTVLTYAVNAQVGGKLAQLGSRLIDSTAKKLADEFFSCFAQKAGAGAPAAAGSAAPHPEGIVEEVEEVAREVEQEVEAKAAVGFLGGPYVWGLLVILALLLVYFVAT